MRVIQLTSAAAAITLIALAGACSSPVAHVAGEAAPVTNPASPATTAVTPSATVPTVATSTQPSKAQPAKGEPAKTVTKKTNPCPVKSSTLHQALQDSTLNEESDAPLLGEPACYQGYAYVREQLRPNYEGEQSWYLFKYNAGTGRWKALSVGTGGVCDGYAPESVQEHFGDGC